jgi:putative endonuclease
MTGRAADRQKRGRRARRRGRWAETLCLWFLRLKGYSIVAHGHVTGQGTGAGEIDIIARRGRLLAFIEVKIRSKPSLAAAAISRNQRHRLTRAAAAFLARRPDLATSVIRFDAILLAPWHWPCHLIDAWREEA